MADVSGKNEAAEVRYAYTKAAYKTPCDPEWRENGIKGGALLFDGASTYVSYKKKDVRLSGEELSVSVWVAPRSFEWDDPNAAAKGEEHLTAILSQYDKRSKTGLLLGFERFGHLCFEVGTGTDWVTVWGDEENGYLDRYKWSLVTAVFDGKSREARLYKNGIIIGKANVKEGSAIAPADNEELLVGKNSDAEMIGAGSYNMFAGLMDELSVKKKAMDEEDIFAGLPDGINKKDLQEGKTPEIVMDDIWFHNVLADDIYKTQYHGGPYQHWMNEPHAPLYYNGKYHLFFQNNMQGTYWRNICWGHLVSDDMVNWKPVKEAIVPTRKSVVPDGVWSGNATKDANGVPILFFTAGNDSFASEGLISNQNIGYAYPKDLTDPDLIEWEIGDELAVKQEKGCGRPGEFRDPYIFKEGNSWFMLLCSGSAKADGGTALLYKTDRLVLGKDGKLDMDWQYMGPIYEIKDQPASLGTSWELPILLKLTNKVGNKSKYAFIISPAPAATADNKVYYFIGNFDIKSGKFKPDKEFEGNPHILDYGSNVFTGPSALVNEKTGETYLFSIMQDQRDPAEEGAAGWAHCVGLTRKIWLNDEGSDIMVSVIDDVNKLQEKPLIDARNISTDEADKALKEAAEKLGDEMYYLKVTFKKKAAGEFGVNLKSNGKRDLTAFLYDTQKGEIKGINKNKGKGSKSAMVKGALALDGKERLTMEIYVDRSLVEGYFNNSKSISMRSYENKDSNIIEIVSDGSAEIEELFLAPMKGIY